MRILHNDITDLHTFSNGYYAVVTLNGTFAGRALYILSYSVNKIKHGVQATQTTTISNITHAKCEEILAHVAELDVE